MWPASPAIKYIEMDILSRLFSSLPSSRFGESTADNHAHATTTVKVVYMCRVSIGNYVFVILNILFSVVSINTSRYQSIHCWMRVTESSHRNFWPGFQGSRHTHASSCMINQERRFLSYFFFALFNSWSRPFVKLYITWIRSLFWLSTN